MRLGVFFCKNCRNHPGAKVLSLCLFLLIERTIVYNFEVVNSINIYKCGHDEEQNCGKNCLLKIYKFINGKYDAFFVCIHQGRQNKKVNYV